MAWSPRLGSNLEQRIFSGKGLVGLPWARARTMVRAMASELGSWLG